MMAKNPTYFKRPFVAASYKARKIAIRGSSVFLNAAKLNNNYSTVPSPSHFVVYHIFHLITQTLLKWLSRFHSENNAQKIIALLFQPTIVYWGTFISMLH
jgi:hypothetical protein